MTLTTTTTTPTTVNYDANRVIHFQDTIYVSCENNLYAYSSETNLWGKISVADLPSQLTITASGSIYVKHHLASDKLVQGEYIGDPVEDVPSSACLCSMKTLMSIGCKCGGE